MRMRPALNINSDVSVLVALRIERKIDDKRKGKTEKIGEDGDGRYMNWCTV